MEGERAETRTQEWKARELRQGHKKGAENEETPAKMGGLSEDI